MTTYFLISCIFSSQFFLSKCINELYVTKGWFKIPEIRLHTKRSGQSQSKLDKVFNHTNENYTHHKISNKMVWLCQPEGILAFTKSQNYSHNNNFCLNFTIFKKYKNIKPSKTNKTKKIFEYSNWLAKIHNQYISNA